MKNVPVALLPTKPADENAVGMSFAEAMQSPCATCDTSPCCSFLPLHRFEVNDLTGLDHAVYLSNFEGIELGIAATGEWHVYYRYPCRYLSREDLGCTIHQQPEQPSICVHYNPYTCWYKRVLTPTTHPEFLRLDRRRLQVILDHIELDEQRHIVRVPNWDWLVETFADMPVEDVSFDDPPVADTVLEEWQLITLGEQPDRGYEVLPYSDPVLQNPCTDCEAYCCQTLSFPLVTPSNMSNFDYMRFCLGFPGVELAVGESAWSLIVKTTCRHLSAGQCTIFGQAERPLVCRYYDALSCTYKVQFGTPRPSTHIRVRLEHLPLLVDTFRFSERGDIIHFPEVASIRERMEDAWRAHGSLTPVPAIAPRREPSPVAVAITTSH